MNNLPPETILHILQYLSGNDLSRFRRLKKSIGKVVNDNRRKPNSLECLPHPKINFSVGQQLHNRFVPGLFFIQTAKCKVCVEVKRDAEIQLLNENVLTKEFMDPFSTYLVKKNQLPHQRIFLEWLFSITDLETLELRPSEDWDNDIELVFKAIRTTKCRCDSVLMMDYFNLIEMFPDTSPVFAQFCRDQKKFGGSPKLQTTSKKAQNSVMFKEHVDTLSVYCNWFNEVLCHYTYKFFFLSLHAIAQRWLDHELEALEAVNFKIRFDIDENIERGAAYIGRRYGEEFLQLDIAFLQPPRQHLLELTEEMTFQGLPEEIVCCRESDDSVLIFKIAKAGRSAFLTVEFVKPT